MKISDAPVDGLLIDIIEKQDITEFYPPQAEAIGPVLEGKSVVLAIPTASGKSLVAYLGVLNNVLNGGKALYIVPLRALATEKYDDLKAFEAAGVRVGVATGDFDDPDPNLEKLDIIVATSEKADSLLRHRTSWLDKISVVVADEVHLINDPSRGPTLEVILTKLKLVNPNLQVIALSATISNSHELADWLGAEHIYSDWRPVELKEGVFFDNIIDFMDGTSHAVLDRKHNMVSLVLDTLLDGGQSLVFVNTRRSTEGLAERLSKAYLKHLDDDEAAAMAELAKEMKEREEEETSIGARLARCLEGGIAFHNAGLTNPQRRFIEENFRERKIKCIVATPTLAAGINLPARRVIVRDLTRYDANFGNVAIPVLEIKQMCGRAGRPQYDPYGEGILVASSNHRKRKIIDYYLLGETEAISSKLGSEPALRTHILATIATGYAANMEELMEFIDGTFFAHQEEIWTIEEAIDDMVEYLDAEGLIDAADGLKATMFGKRTSDLYIDPMSAVKMREAIDLSEEKETNAFSLLHVACSTPDMYKLYLRKGDYEWLEEVVDENEDNLLFPIPDGADYEYFLSEIKTALLLDAWIEEISENAIVNKFNVGPGDIRNRVDTAEWLVYSMRELARLYGNPVTEDLNHLVVRIKSGIKEELLPLARLRGIGRRRARALFDRGFKSLRDLDSATVKQLASVPMMGDRLAKNIKAELENLKF